MTPQPTDAVREVYELLWTAAARRQPVTAMYDGLPRLLCRHVLGRKSGCFHVLVYQFGGSSHRGLPMVAEGAGVWRCLAVEKLTEVELRTDAWHTAPRAPRQTCIDEIDIDVDAQRDEHPQKGQWGSCRNNTRASIVRSVAIECGLCRSARVRRAARAEVRRWWPGGNESKMPGAGRGGKTAPLGYQEPIRCNA